VDVECQSFLVEIDLLFTTVYISVEEHVFLIISGLGKEVTQEA
jgi:hypothetical protein